MKKQLAVLSCLAIALALASSITSVSSDGVSAAGVPGDARPAPGAKSEAGATAGIPAPVRSSASSNQIQEAAAGLSPFMRRQFLSGGMFESHTPASEIIESRGRNAKHFQGPGGTAVAVLTSRPVHFKNSNGSWQDIDTRITRSVSTSKTFENITNNVMSSFPAAGLASRGVSVGSDGEVITIGLNPSLVWADDNGATTTIETAVSSAAAVKDDTITYPGALPSADSRFTVDTDHLKNDVVLKRIPDSLVGKSGFAGYSEEIELPEGWYLASGGQRINHRMRTMGALDVVDDTGKTIYSFPRPAVYDAQTSSADMGTALAPGAFFEVSRAGSRMQVITLAPLSWLLAGERRFPVTIDPTVDFQTLASVGDWLICPSCACPGCNPPILPPAPFQPSAPQAPFPSNSYNRDQQSDTGWFSFDVSWLKGDCITQTQFKSLRAQMFTNLTCLSSIDIDLYSVLVQPGPTNAFGDALIAAPSVGTMHYSGTACSINFLDISAGANADIKTAAQQNLLYTIGLATSESPGALSAFFGPILEITYFDETISPPTLPTATVGVPFSVSLSTASGSPTYSATGFPSSITLSGSTFSGTPTRPGTFAVSVTATDSSTGCINTNNYTFTVACATTLSPSTLAGGTAGSPYSVAFSGSSGSPQWTATGLPTGLAMGLTTGILSGTPTQTGTFTVAVDANDASIGCEIKKNYSLVIACQAITVGVPAIAAGTAGVAYGSVTFTESGGLTPVTFAETGPLPTGMTLSTGGVLSGTPTKTGTFNFSVIATDTNGCTGSHAASITINCPTITVTTPTIPAGAAGVGFAPVTFTQSAGVGTITFTETGALPTGMTLSTGGVLSGTPLQTGTFPFTVTATDSNGCTGTSGASITINCPTISVGPASISSGTAGVAYAGATFTESAGVGAITFTESGALPAGITFSAGVLSGTPTQTGTFPFTVTATDVNNCTGSAPYTLTVVCPVISVGPATVSTATAGVAYSAVNFTQTGGVGTITFTETGALPAGMTFNAGVLSGTPTKIGTFPFSVKATDANGCSGMTSYSLVVNCPVISVGPGAVGSGVAGVAYASITFTESGGVGAIAYSETGALPAGMTFAAGILSGTPLQIGTYPFSVKATDSNGCSGMSSYSLVIVCPTINVGPGAIYSGIAGVPYTTTHFTESGGVGAVTYMESGTLPSGMSFTSAGILSGTPLQIGSYPITITATDANACTGSSKYTLVIACPAIVVSVNAPAAVQFVPYQPVQFSETGGVGLVQYTTSSSLPVGMMLSAAGVLSGTPLTAGAFPLTVTATDVNGCTGSLTLTLNVTALDKCLQDVNTGDTFQFSSVTGDYLLTRCATGYTMSGRGTLSTPSGMISLSDSKADRRVTAGYNPSQRTGTANITVINGASTIIKINSTNPNHTCVCANRSARYLSDEAHPGELAQGAAESPLQFTIHTLATLWRSPAAHRFL